ncbi:tail fiber protein [Pseudomonas fluorescens]|uniref:tail fiber protein n=1 Tax=Pseudomonas fluorescens TaxID=294 RepID=UPI0011329C1A|nr:tail fiber protein [Pseudomonas fluorescens]TMU74662.1 tail fiber protein [Pseudomonas fluorescens]
MADTTQQTGVGPTVEQLKNVFGVEQVPLASNFSDLVDVADVGRKAAGLSPEQDGTPGLGLQLDAAQKLAVRLKTGGGMAVSDVGINVTADTSMGLAVRPAGVGVTLEPNKGLSVSTAGVAIKLEPNKGLAVGAKGVALTPGNGINLGTLGVGVTVELGKGLSVGPAGVAVTLQPNKGLSVGPAGVAVALEPGKGLSVGANGVAVQPGNGITVSTSGVSIDRTQLLVPGMIMMFSGAVAPAGWAFCDGAEGRPDLRNRFVLGGSGSEVNTQGGSQLTGTGAAKGYSVTTNAASAGPISVNIAATVLSEAQIPSHKHLDGVRFRCDNDTHFDSVTVYGITNPSYVNNSISWSGMPNGWGAAAAWTSSTGGGQGHTHAKSTATQGMHSHTLTTLPAYYILAFIIKL